MKKSTKTALIVAAILLVCGAVVCGLALRGVGYDFARLSTGSDENREIKNETFDAADFSKIVIDIEVDDLRISRSRDDRIHLQYVQRERNQYTVSSDDGVLHLTQGHLRQWVVFDFNLFVEDNDVVLELPDGFAGDLQLTSDVGGIRFEEAFRLEGALDCKLDTGDFDADGLEARSVTVQTDIGGIRGEDWTVGKYLFLTTETGDIRLENGAVDGDLICRTDIGGVHLERVTADTAELTTETGDVKLDRLAADRITAETDIGSVSGTIAGSEREYNITTETDIGDSSLKDRSGTTGKELNVTTETGDIDLEFTKP